jgi:hypothetical protein
MSDTHVRVTFNPHYSPPNYSSDSLAHRLSFARFSRQVLYFVGGLVDLPPCDAQPHGGFSY